MVTTGSRYDREVALGSTFLPPSYTNYISFAATACSWYLAKTSLNVAVSRDLLQAGLVDGRVRFTSHNLARTAQSCDCFLPVCVNVSSATSFGWGNRKMWGLIPSASLWAILLILCQGLK